MALDRRDFLKSSLSAGALAFLPPRFAWSKAINVAAGQGDASPIQIVPNGRFSSREFTGDDIERTHKILWNIEGYVNDNGGWPEASETSDVVVVGGGIAGLYGAYCLRDQNVVILEQDRIFGGNSKGEVMGKSQYSIGAAYLVSPNPDGRVGRLLNELGLWDSLKTESPTEATVFENSRFAKGFWAGSTDPEARTEFTRVFKKLQIVLSNIRKLTDSQLKALDRLSFEQWVQAELGQVHPHIMEYFQLYAWSSFAGSINELSAIQMIGFIAAETRPLATLPGGNALIAQRMYEELRTSLGTKNVRAGMLTIDVRSDGDDMIVTYVKPAGDLAAIRTRQVLFAAPKYVAGRTIPEMPQDQINAINTLSYRGYIVANIFLDSAIESPTYELYCLENEVPPAPSAMKPSSRPFTDITFGTWAQDDDVDNSVLTVYKAFAFDGDRQFLFNPTAHNKYRDRILNGIQPILGAMGLSSSNIAGIRMTRWGHSLPVASKGLIANGTLETVRRPIANSIYFANQDNWANPSFETATAEGEKAALAIRANLGV